MVQSSNVKRKSNANLLFLIIMIVSFVSCTNVDTKDVFSIAEQVEKSLKQNKIDKLKPFFDPPMDSLLQEDKDRIKEIQDFYRENSVKKIEVDTILLFWSFTVCDISYLVNDTYYEVRFFYKRDSLGNVVINTPVLRNISEICAEDGEKPYCPMWSIDFKKLSWTTDYYEKTVNNGKIEFQNNTDYDINYIKFRIKLRRGYSYYYGETFFNQTVESYKPIYKGDIVSIEIPGLSNYYTGFTIDKDAIRFEAELIEIRPKPISGACLKIQKLDTKVKTMLNK
jgi:hypothetical protein